MTLTKIYIEAWRKEKGVSRAWLADKVGVCRQAVWQWENEANEITLKHFNAVAKALGVEPGHLYTKPRRND